jgi:hypothetical protein
VSTATIAETETVVRPKLNGLHVSPASVDRYTPFREDPANRKEPMAVSEVMLEFGKPEFDVDQLAPLFVDRKTPLPNVAAYRYSPPSNRREAKQATVPPSGPAV